MDIMRYLPLINKPNEKQLQQQIINIRAFNAATSVELKSTIKKYLENKD